MLQIFLGPDDFSKKEYLDGLAKGLKAEVQIYMAGDEVPGVLRLVEQNLFSKAKIFILEGLLSQLDFSESDLDRLIASQNQIFIIEETVDKRLAKNKQLLKNQKIIIKQFNLPHGKDLNKWISERIKALGGKISPSAAEVLAVLLGRDDAEEVKVGGKVVSVKEIFSLWQVKNEIDKLLAYAKDREISEADVKLLVNENGEVDAFEITNAIGDGNKNLALNLVGEYLSQQSSADEKISIIQLNALLAEQFRNVAALQDFLQRCAQEKDILEKTLWKPGRVFVMKKIAQKFTREKILGLLGKLSALDEELKTSSTPPKVLVDLILAQLF